MSKRHTPLIVGNWKMNPQTVGEAKKLFLAVRKEVGRYKNEVDVVIAPPFPFLSELERLSPSQRIKLAAQDVFYETKGAFTGEVSLPMLKSVGVTHAIIGHSERRALGETDDDVARDILAALKHNVVVVACIGEKKRDNQGTHFSVVEAQLHAALKEVPKAKLKNLSVMYEPIWAISSGDGKGETATPEDIEEMRLFMLKVLSDRFGRKEAKKIKILYGGSVNKKNVEDIFVRGGVDGYVVGGASLRAEEFVEIIKLTAKLKKHAK